MSPAQARVALSQLTRAIRIGVVCVATSTFSAGCGGDESGGSFQQIHTVSSVKVNDDVRWGDLTGIESQVYPDLIPTLTFNQSTIWPSVYVSEADLVLSQGKDPGLGVRALHEQGITGAGVAVAIIDQNICLDHPEYAGKVLEYHDVGTGKDGNSGSMHGPAVLSLLVGDSIGTAPGASVYFVAAPSWTRDAQYQADALNWIINRNRQLPADAKIRAVSISAAPSGPGSPFTSHNSAWDAARTQAESEGIAVLDCTADHGRTAAGYRDLLSPDDITKFTLGFLGQETSGVDTQRLYIPTSKRTTAEEYSKGQSAYQYTGQGGLSWSIPYLTGVLALGWQLRPELTGEQMLDLAFSSAYVINGAKVIDPPAFVDSVQAF